jgi:hypothetical protein
VRALLASISLATLLAAACSSTQDATLSITLGGEADALTRAPAPVSLVVDTLDLDGGPTTLATVPLPATSADLGNLSADLSGSVRITGKDTAGIPRVWGASIAVSFASIAGGTLQVFVQRTGEMARMPGVLTDAREGPFLGVASNQYLMVTGGTDSAQAPTTVLYDLLGYKAVGSPPTFSRTPKSFAVSYTYAVAIDDDGASYLSLADDSSGTLTAPSGSTFADVSGGATVMGPDGTAYVVGPTRTTTASSKVLTLDVNGALAFLALASPRLGAGTAYVAGRGLVVFGGDAKAPAIEIVPPGATASTVTTLPPQNVAGSAGTALDGDRVLFVWATGTTGSFFTVDLAHPDPAAVAVTATLPCSAKHVDVQTLDPKTVLVVAEDGPSCAFTWDGTTVKEVPLRIARRGARAIRLPTGAVAIVGGNATIEQFTP